jgi:hypothetical protein
MFKRKLSVFLVSLVSVACIVQIAGAARLEAVRIGDQRQLRPTQARPSKLDPSAALRAAQAWLKSIGYDLPLEEVPKLKRLQLQLYSEEYIPKITDDTLSHLRVLKGLEEIILPGWIGDKGISNLAGLTNLKLLSVSIAKVTDAGLDHLKNLTALTQLSLHGDNITDAGIAKIRHLSALAYLGLNDTKITDAAVAMIAGLKNLKSLSLTRTAVSDASIPYLRQMTGLTRLDIQSAKITKAGLAQLRDALPNCMIYY